MSSHLCSYCQRSRLRGIQCTKSHYIVWFMNSFYAATAALLSKKGKKKIIFMHCRSCHGLVQWCSAQDSGCCPWTWAFRSNIWIAICVHSLHIWPSQHPSRQAYSVRRLYTSCFSCTTTRSILRWHCPTIMCFIFSSYYKLMIEVRILSAEWIILNPAKLCLVNLW